MTYKWLTTLKKYSGAYIDNCSCILFIKNRKVLFSWLWQIQFSSSEARSWKKSKSSVAVQYIYRELELKMGSEMLQQVQNRASNHTVDVSTECKGNSLKISLTLSYTKQSDQLICATNASNNTKNSLLMSSSPSLSKTFPIIAIKPCIC